MGLGGAANVPKEEGYDTPGVVVRVIGGNDLWAEEPSARAE